MPTTLKVEVSFANEVEVKLNISKERFDELSDEAKEVLIENAINKTTAMRGASFVSSEVLEVVEEV